MSTVKKAKVSRRVGLFNMNRFFEKSATLADGPTLTNFANYLDCTATLNPELGMLKKCSANLRQNMSVQAAFKAAYPNMTKESRAKVAARLVSTYLQTRQQVADALRTLERSNG